MAELELEFVDAQEMAKKHPATFQVPGKEALDKIGPDDIVKVSIKRERFWVKVVKVDGDKVTGIVDNDLLTDDADCGDEVSFEKKNIYSIWRGGEIEN